MEICDVRDTCALYNDEIIGLDITTRIMKSKYCLENFTRCICYENCKEQEMASVRVICPAGKNANAIIVAAPSTSTILHQPPQIEFSE